MLKSIRNLSYPTYFFKTLTNSFITAKYSYGGENVFINTLRVVCVVPKKEVSWYEITPADYWVNLHDKNGKEVDTVIFHVFRVRKCISMNTEGN